METMKVQAIWEFEVDTSNFDPKHVNIRKIAMELAGRELNDLLNKNELSTEDFEYTIGWYVWWVYLRKVILCITIRKYF